MAKIHLKGMSWDHPRGHDPMVATAKRFGELHPDIDIQFSTRSLKDFGDFPIEKLTDTYDIIVIDHPFCGVAVETGCILPLEGLVGADFLAEQAANSVGPSHRSYDFAGHHWALATDAAGHVSAHRPDLLAALGVAAPTTWDEVMALARKQAGTGYAQVAVPTVPVDAIMAFCSIATTHGEEPFLDGEHVVSRQMGRFVLEFLRELVGAGHPLCTKRNPPQTLDIMSDTDEIAYVPLLFGYSNYGRPGFRKNVVRFAPVPGGAGGIIGGAGVAISANCKHVEAAAAYAKFVADPDTQRGLYFQSGGQPGHRKAWLDPAVNAACSNFFFDTLPGLDAGYLRPRYLGYMHVQETSGQIINRFLAEGGEIDAVLDQLDDLYRHSNPPRG